MEKKKKIIIVVATLIVIILLIILALAETIKNGDDSNAKNKIDSQQTGTNYWDFVDVYEGTVAAKDNQETTTNKNQVVTNKKGEAVTNKSSETVTKKNKKKKEKTTESYPGEDEGWSPIVSPDDIEE